MPISHNRVMRPLTYATLIPTRGRWDLFGKTLRRQPFLNTASTYVGIENDEYRQYLAIFRDIFHGDNPRFRIVTYTNKEGSVGVAREALRKAATRDKYNYYIATDDNAKFKENACVALVQSAEAWRLATGKLTFVCGMHNTASHFDRRKILANRDVDGWITYPNINFIFHTMPHDWYARYAYPPSCFALEDRHMMLAAIDAGHTEFRVSMDAPFTKSRYQHGGQGDIQKRQWNCGRSIEQLAHDFPSYVGARGTLPLPWQFIMQLRGGAKVDRLLGGAMRKGDVLTGKMKIRTRKVERA